jgi:hypothetical protein
MLDHLTYIQNRMSGMSRMSDILFYSLIPHLCQSGK